MRLAYSGDGREAWPYELWCMLASSPGFCNELVRLQLRFADGALWVTGSFADSDGLHDALYAVMLQAFRASEWSDSRWGASTTQHDKR